MHETEVQCEKRPLPWESCWTEKRWKHGPREVRLRRGPIGHWCCPSKETNVRDVSSKFSLGHCAIPGLGKEAAAQLLPRKLQVCKINVLDRNRALEHRCGRAHTFQSSDDFLPLTVVAALVNRGVLDRCFSLRVRAGGFRLVSR